MPQTCRLGGINLNFQRYSTLTVRLQSGGLRMKD
jgi:hypothetical protein